jgi:hypothetical protein
VLLFFFENNDFMNDRPFENAIYWIFLVNESFVLWMLQWVISDFDALVVRTYSYILSINIFFTSLTIENSFTKKAVFSLHLSGKKLLNCIVCHFRWYEEKKSFICVEKNTYKLNFNYSKRFHFSQHFLNLISFHFKLRNDNLMRKFNISSNDFALQ